MASIPETAARKRTPLPENPYNFGSAIVNPDLFVGRDSELNELNYYLDYSRTSETPIHLAIVGPRAAGKTSLLNMAEAAARLKGLLPIRIELDEGDGRSPLLFFQKLIDSIVLTSFAAGAFGGLGGKLHKNYVESVFGGKPLNDFPLMFPYQYAAAVASHHFDSPVSEAAVKSDLMRIQAEIHTTLVVMIDEGNVLDVGREILQKLRNAVMSQRGYMIILAGTPDLFPEIDHVFSPISRQFKKIALDPFKDQNETRRCVIAPLENAGLDPFKILDLDTYRNIRTIHEISSGRPYEINLLCHYMYRRLQEGRVKRMQLDLDVLEDVRRHLESEQELARHPIVAIVNGMDRQQLKALGTFSLGDQVSSFDDAWAAEYTFNGSANWTQTRMREQLDDLIARGVYKEDQNKICFVGDEFDRLYTTYFCREKDLLFSLPPRGIGLDSYWWVHLHVWFHEHRAMEIGYLKRGEEQEQLSEKGLIETLNSMSGLVEDWELLDKRFSTVEDLYDFMVHNKDKTDFVAWRIKVHFRSVAFTCLFSGPALEDPSKRSELETQFEPIQRRLAELGGQITIDQVTVPVYDLSQIVETVKRSPKKRIQKDLALNHATSATHYYIEHDDKATASFHAGLALEYGADIPPSLLNNLGYIFLAAGKLGEARSMLVRARRGVEGDDEDEALVLFNSAVLEIKTGDPAAGLQLLDLSIAKCQQLDEDTRRKLRLLVGRFEGALTFIEAKGPDLLVAARQTREALLCAFPKLVSD